MAKVKTVDLSDKMPPYFSELINEAVNNALVNSGIDSPEFSWTLEAEVWDEFNKIEEN